MRPRPRIRRCRLFELRELLRPNHLPRQAATAFLLAAGCIAGCAKSEPVPADLSKTPWLDPRAQINSLKQSDPRIRSGAARNLGEMGPKAVDALPELDRLAREDPAENVRKRAREAVEKIRAVTNISKP
jgi:HEAT repeat protein